MKNKLALFCARIDAHAGVVLDILSEHYQYDIAGFFDDNPEFQNKHIANIPVIGTIQSFPENLPDDVNQFFVCTGNNQVRSYCFNLIQAYGLKPVNVIHPSAVISKSVQIGKGTFIGANASITHNVRIGDGVLINTAAVIEHDNIIQDFVNISPHCTTSGRVVIKESAFLGSATTIIPDINIGENAYIAAGAVVTQNIPPNSKYGGVPARPIK